MSLWWGLKERIYTKCSALSSEYKRDSENSNSLSSNAYCMPTLSLHSLILPKILKSDRGFFWTYFMFFLFTPFYHGYLQLPVLLYMHLSSPIWFSGSSLVQEYEWTTQALRVPNSHSLGSNASWANNCYNDSLRNRLDTDSTSYRKLSNRKLLWVFYFELDFSLVREKCIRNS